MPSWGWRTHFQAWSGVLQGSLETYTWDSWSWNRLRSKKERTQRIQTSEKGSMCSVLPFQAILHVHHLWCHNLQLEKCWNCLMSHIKSSLEHRNAPLRCASCIQTHVIFGISTLFYCQSFQLQRLLKNFQSWQLIGHRLRSFEVLTSDKCDSVHLKHSFWSWLHPVLTGVSLPCSSPCINRWFRFSDWSDSIPISQVSSWCSFWSNWWGNSTML